MLVRYNVCYPRSRSKVMQKVDAGNEEETRNPQNKNASEEETHKKRWRKTSLKNTKSQAPKVVRSQDSRDQYWAGIRPAGKENWRVSFTDMQL